MSFPMMHEFRRGLPPLTHTPRLNIPKQPNPLNRVQPKVSGKLWAVERAIKTYLADADLVGDIIYFTEIKSKGFFPALTGWGGGNKIKGEISRRPSS